MIVIFEEIPSRHIKRRNPVRTRVTVVLLGLLFLSIVSCTEKEAKLSEILDIPANFQSAYKILKEEDYSYATVVRKGIKISVPKGLTKETLELNLKHAAKTLYEKYKPNALTVFAYREGDSIEGSYTAGKCDFAPYGKWKRANENVPLEKYDVTIDINELYFKPIKEEYTAGTAIKLQDKSSDTIDISNKSNAWRDENIIVRVPNGTDAEILDSATFPLGNTEMIRYKIKVTYRGKGYIGWIFESAVKVK